ncbi:hypothetical protein E3J48_03590 [Candidatus Aerophobetes bacterium]|uniref:SH3 domain-containing protein n=1 Tax=Aerophobetes bacterium TaxID=2030807 RepID=A0A523W7A5_UNCAE|nr:MAG: hypothetical protein E3J48_03590 [Candidatus Aerophobetes bacterium]
MQQQNIDLQQQNKKLEEQTAELDWAEKIEELGNKKDALVDHEFKSLLSQFIEKSIDILSFKQEFAGIEEQLSRNETRFNEILNSCRELYRRQGLKEEEISEKIKNKSKFYGSPYSKLTLDICRRNLRSLTERASPEREKCGRLFVAARVLDPEVVKLEVTAPMGCNIRIDPDIRGDNVIGTVAHGSELLAQNSYYSWYQVRVTEWVSQEDEKNVGWIWDKNVKPKKEGFL